jgi:hypothetical protein
VVLSPGRWIFRLREGKGRGFERKEKRGGKKRKGKNKRRGSEEKNKNEIDYIFLEIVMHKFYNPYYYGIMKIECDSYIN